MQMSGGSVVWILDADSGKFTQAMIQAERKADETGRNVDRSLSNASSGVASSLANIGKQIGAIAWNSIQNGASIAGSALFALGARGINSANELQSLQLSMNGLTKSMTLGAKAMAEAYKYALSSPFQLSSVAAATKTMIAFGLNVDDATKSLKTLGNISITTGIPIEAMANIFGRVSAQGRLMGGDIQQLTENGVAILPQLQKQLGKTSEEVRKMASDGEISFAQFTKALNSLVDPSILAQLENTLPRQLDRLNGSIRQMAFALVGASVDTTNGFKLLNTSIGQSVINITRNLANAFRSKPILDALARLGNTAVPLFDAIARAIEPMVAGMAKFIDVTASMGPILLPILGLIIGRIGGLFAQFPIVGELLAGFTGPMGLALGLMAALVAYSPELRSGIAEGFKIISDTLKELSPVFKEMLDGFKTASGQLGSALKPVVIALAQAFSAVLKALAPVIPILGEALVTAVVALAPALVVAADAIRVIAEAFAGLDPNVQKFLVNAVLIGVAVGTLASKFKPITGVLGKFSGVFGKIFGGKAAKAGAGVGNAIGSTIEAIFKPLANPTVLKGAAGATMIGVALAAVTFGISQASKVQINFGNLGIVVASIAVLTLIFTLLGKLGPAAIVGGVAAAAIGAGLYVAAWGITNASKMGGEIDIAGLAGMMAALIVVGAILALVAQFALLGAVGALGAAVIGGGLLVATLALVQVSKLAPQVNGQAIQKLSGTIAIVSVILGLIAPFAAFGAIASIANMIIAGGLLVATIALVEVSKRVNGIITSNIDKLMGILTKVNLILAALSAFSLFTGLGTIVQTVIVAGVLNAAIKLRQASEIAGGITVGNMIKLYDAMQWIAKLQTGGIIDNLRNMVNSAVMAKTAEQIQKVVATLNATQAIDVNRVQKLNDVMKKLSELKTSGVFKAVGDMITTGTLSKVAENIKSVTESFANIKIVNTSAVDKLNEMMNKLSQIKLENGGLFDNRGGKAKELAEVADNIRIVTDKLQGLRTDGLIDKANAFENAISRGGKGWPIVWAQQFIDYAKKLQGDGGFELVNNFINSVFTWKTNELLNKFNQLENAISRGGKGWPMTWAQSFKDYVSKLSGDGSVSLVSDFIGKVMGWNTAILLEKFNNLEKAISRDGKGWPATWADQFKSYINKLVGDRSIEMVVNFINTVLGWNTGVLLGKFNEFEKAVSRDGKGWEPWYAQRFNGYLQALKGDGSYQGVGAFINSVTGWNTAGLLQKFNEFEKAISRDGKSWEPWYAQQFTSYFSALSGVPSMSGIQPMIATVATWNTAVLLQKFNEFENAISRQGRGWPVNWVNSFVSYFSALSGLNYDFSNVRKIIAGFSGINAENVGAAAQALLTVVSTIAQGAAGKGPEFFKAGSTLSQALIGGIRSGGAGAGAAGASIQGAMWNAIQAKMGDEYQQGRALATQVINGIRSVGSSQAGAAGAALQGAFWRGIQDKFPDEYQQGRALVQQVINGIRSNTGGAYSAGANATQGFINGANSKSPYSTGWNIANQYLQGLKDRGKQGSPWKETASIGVFAGQGLIEGIEKTQNQLYRTATSMVDGLLNIMDVGSVGINPQLQINGMDANMADVSSLSRSIGSFDYNDSKGSVVENHIGTIEIASEVDAQNWLQKLTRDDEVTRGGMTSGVTA